MSENLNVRFMAYMLLIVLCFFAFVAIVQFSVLWNVPYLSAFALFPLAACYYLADKAVFGDVED